MEQAIGRTIAGIVIGDWIVILVEAEVVHIRAEVNIEASIAIVVGYGGVREGSLRRTCKPEGIALDGEGAVALIEEEQGTGAANDEQVLEPPVLKVGEQSAGGTVEHADAGFFRYVFKGSVTAVAVKPVWQSGRLADIEVIEAVIVEVARRHAIVGINVDADGAVHDRAPVVDAAKHLPGVGFSSAKSLRSDVEKGLPAGDAEGFFASLPPARCPHLRWIARPLGAP